MDLYFSKFPVINYNNTLCRNITERVSIVKGQERIPVQYYPYELKEETRSDLLANHYYEDPTLDWLIYLTNGMTDPYYDWYLTSEEFNNFIKDKYGSIEAAQQQVVYYRSNWSDDYTNMTLSGYAALTEALKKYWSPVYGEKSRILYYQRRQQDWIVSTNQLVQLDIELTGANTFLVGERVSTANGTGWVTSASNTELIIQHVTGNTTTSDITVTGANSGATANVTFGAVLQYNIPLEEQAYWVPVYAYDIENEQNEQKKYLYLLDSGFALATSETIRRQLNE